MKPPSFLYTLRMKCSVIQPPFVQLNAPYPAAWYLQSWLTARGQDAQAYDHSIEIFRSIMCRKGLARVFRDAEAIWPSKVAGSDAASRSQVERYLSSRDVYLAWIDGIVAFLSGKDPSFAHRLTTSAGIPTGSRVERYIEDAGRPLSAEAAPLLATRILEDLCDFIGFVLDRDFGMIRYADRLASGFSDFSGLRKAQESSYILNSFYAPYLEGFLERAGDSDLYLVTIPFPGCLVPALHLAQALKNKAKAGARILFGGGYVSTELRALTDPGIFDFCDALCFDAGYDALEALLADPAFQPGGEWPSGSAGNLPSIAYRDASGQVRYGRIREDWGAGFPGWKPGSGAPSRSSDPAAEGSRMDADKRHTLERSFPDYRSLDPSRYLRIVDSLNPMHRLWSDSPWLKYQLAVGCYWARCSFCDTTLEYVADCVRVDVPGLLASCDAAQAATGIRGIHFVDEAMPMADLLAFAAGNRERMLSGSGAFHFWGNMRFDASWTPERCGLLAASGLVAVSGGIEIASEEGLAMTDKGFDLASLIACLVALKDAGILVHAYLIYGFPEQSGKSILESAEIVRQLFALGLVDSAFWHRFVLTRHSRIYAEWKSGRRPGLRPLDRKSRFADNDLDFEGSARFDAFDAPLAQSLAAWMEGERLDEGIGAWFPQRSKEARTPLPDENLVASLAAKARSRIDSARGGPVPESCRAYWTAGLPRIEAGAGLPRSMAGQDLPGIASGSIKRHKKGGAGTSTHPAESAIGTGHLVWVKDGAMVRMEVPANLGSNLAQAIGRLAASAAGMDAKAFLAMAFPGAPASSRPLATLRRGGLVFV